MRESANAPTGTSRPFSVIECTSRAIRSMNVSAPSVAEKRTTVRDPKTSAPLVRSRPTSYEWVSTIARRSCASMRVRFSPGTAAPDV